MFESENISPDPRRFVCGTASRDLRSSHFFPPPFRSTSNRGPIPAVGVKIKIINRELKKKKKKPRRTINHILLSSFCKLRAGLRRNGLFKYNEFFAFTKKKGWRYVRFFISLRRNIEGYKIFCPRRVWHVCHKLLQNFNRKKKKKKERDRYVSCKTFLIWSLLCNYVNNGIDEFDRRSCSFF